MQKILATTRTFRQEVENLMIWRRKGGGIVDSASDKNAGQGGPYFSKVVRRFLSRYHSCMGTKLGHMPNLWSLRPPAAKLNTFKMSASH